MVVYPLCKRFTHWPQAVLGLAMNWGLMMGAVAMGARGASGQEPLTVLQAMGRLPEEGLYPFMEAAAAVDTSVLAHCVPAYLGAAAWTVVYDTIYAH